MLCDCTCAIVEAKIEEGTMKWSKRVAQTVDLHAF